MEVKEKDEILGLVLKSFGDGPFVRVNIQILESTVAISYAGYAIKRRKIILVKCMRSIDAPETKDLEIDITEISMES